MATIIQEIKFKNTTAKSIYDLYMNAKLHEMITGGIVKISEKPGSKLDVFGGYITGKTIQAVKNKIIVQQWRGSDWDAKEDDSVFVLSFEQKGKDVVLKVFHANVPADQAKGLDKGWHDHYWNPWKQYLKGKQIKRREN